MDGIAHEVELNKATLYLYLKTRSTLRCHCAPGHRDPAEKYEECMKTQVTGIAKVACWARPITGF